MLTIAGVRYTLSEVVQLIKQNPNSPWKRGYPFYLIKISKSGRTDFNTYIDLLMKLANYVMGEPPDNPVLLARYRGPGPTGNSAMTLAPINHNAVNRLDVAAINHLMTTGGIGNGISRESPHQTDPETGRPKGRGVVVKEYDVNGREGRRATKRTEQRKTTYYYSDSHSFATYKYARLT